MNPTTQPIYNMPHWAIVLCGVIVGLSVVLTMTRKVLFPAMAAMASPIQQAILWALGIKKEIDALHAKSADNSAKIGENATRIAALEDPPQGQVRT